MKRRILSLLIVVSMLFAVACGAKTDAPKEEKKAKTEEGAKKDKVKLAFIVGGTLGDKSFYDSAERGLKALKDKYGDKLDVKVTELQMDETKFVPTLEEYSESKQYDIILVGSFTMRSALEKVAKEFPEQKYMMFDEDVDMPNVYSMMFKQNEVSFLAGVLAAKMTTLKDDPRIKHPEEKSVGFLGGMENPVINDFLVGYIQGAKYVDKDMKVVVSTVGNFADTAKGKDLALAQYNQNKVDVGYNVAGRAGFGQIEAAKEANRYAIGVDSDQAAVIGAPMDDYILTSALKNIDNALILSLIHISEPTRRPG